MLLSLAFDCVVFVGRHRCFLAWCATLKLFSLVQDTDASQLGLRLCCVCVLCEYHDSSNEWVRFHCMKMLSPSLHPFAQAVSACHPSRAAGGALVFFHNFVSPRCRSYLSICTRRSSIPLPPPGSTYLLFACVFVCVCVCACVCIFTLYLLGLKRAQRRRDTQLLAHPFDHGRCGVLGKAPWKCCAW